MNDDKMVIRIKMSEIILPSEETIIATAKYLLERLKPEADAKYPSVREILCRVGAGDAMTPDALPKYNPFYIKRTLTRLIKQKFIEKQDGEYALTVDGKRWILKYTLAELTIPKPAKWDGRWRMVMYDVAGHQASLRNIFRASLKRMGFITLQESVWLYPYPCEKEIHFLRDFCGMGDNVIYIIAHKIENDVSYRKKFNLA